MSQSPVEYLQESAAEHRVYISCGDLEATGILPDTYYLCHKLIGPSGEILANYRRSQPTPPALNAFLYNGKRHLLPGDGPSVVQTSFGNVGLIICSEIKVPELARVEMLMGAEILIGPIGGGTHNRQVDAQGVPLARAKMRVWKAIALARAAENLMFTIITSNMRHPEALWGSCICSSEGILAEGEGPGIIYATLDFERLRLMRSRCWIEEDFGVEPIVNPPFVTDPGQHRDRRPDLYGRITERQSDAFDYFYGQQGLENWRDFDRTGIAPASSG